MLKTRRESGTTTRVPPSDARPAPTGRGRERARNGASATSHSNNTTPTAQRIALPRPSSRSGSTVRRWSSEGKPAEVPRNSLRKWYLCRHRDSRITRASGQTLKMPSTLQRVVSPFYSGGYDSGQSRLDHDGRRRKQLPARVSSLVRGRYLCLVYRL